MQGDNAEDSLDPPVDPIWVCHGEMKQSSEHVIPLK